MVNRKEKILYDVEYKEIKCPTSGLLAKTNKSWSDATVTSIRRLLKFSVHKEVKW